MAKAQTKYVDGFVLIVEKKNVAAYRKVAKQAGEIWMKHGALSYKECMGDDLNPDTGEDCPTTTFPQMLKPKPNETIWYSFIEYKSKAHRDQVNKRVMKEMAEDAAKNTPEEMPFDSKKMAFGGFKVEIGF